MKESIILNFSQERVQQAVTVRGLLQSKGYNSLFRTDKEHESGNQYAQVIVDVPKDVSFEMTVQEVLYAIRKARKVI